MGAVYLGAVLPAAGPALETNLSTTCFGAELLAAVSASGAACLGAGQTAAGPSLGAGLTAAGADPLAASLAAATPLQYSL